MEKVEEIDLKNYTVDTYKKDIKKYGLKNLWDYLLEKLLIEQIDNSLFNYENFGELYEIGLEELEKKKKQKEGKYYTPKDVSAVMAEWLFKNSGENVCDIGCGTGNLILAYFDYIGYEKTRELILGNHVYLYDSDKLATKICQYTIGLKYGRDLMEHLNIVTSDFLNESTTLPENCKIICNPPYYKIEKIKNTWQNTNIIQDTKEYYSAFMEKIIDNSQSSVIISPYSFIGGEKFFSLRKKLNEHNGFIVAFDNVPGNIFLGKKHGVFNTNSSNSVRAAITVVENKENKNGFKVSPLIRFKTEERKRLINCLTLESLLNPNYQTITEENKKYYKCFKELDSIYNKWIIKSNKKLKDLISTKKTKYMLCIPKTCRYFTTGSSLDLNRDGKYNLYFKNELEFNYAYCLINSSFAYWYWRIYDGGITYPLNLLLDCPIFVDEENKKQQKELEKIVTEMISCEKDYFVYKKNAQKVQENIKFPEKYRDRINRIMFDILGIEGSMGILNIIHSNSIFDLKEGKDDQR